jgi:hypothetical protein
MVGLLAVEPDKGVEVNELLTPENLTLQQYLNEGQGKSPGDPAFT